MKCRGSQLLKGEPEPENCCKDREKNGPRKEQVQNQEEIFYQTSVHNLGMNNLNRTFLYQ